MDVRRVALYGSETPSLIIVSKTFLKVLHWAGNLTEEKPPRVPFVYCKYDLITCEWWRNNLRHYIIMTHLNRWLKGPIHDQSCCAKMFCTTQVCTKYDSIHVATWLHNFSWVLRAIVLVSHILNITSEACVAVILALERNPEKAKKRCFYINDWIPIDTCCATSPLTMQTSCATAVLHKKYQNSSDFMQRIVQIVSQHHTRSTSCTTRNAAQHDWSWMEAYNTKEHRLRVYENKELGKIFGPKRE
jgi:hypothetical protein